MLSKLMDSAGHTITLSGDHLVYMVAKRNLSSSNELFRIYGQIIDTTTGYVSFPLYYFDSTHEPGTIYVEVRVSYAGTERVAGQYRSSIVQSLGRASFYDIDLVPRYDTHIMLYNNTLEDIGGEHLLGEYDTIFVNHESFNYLPTEYRNKAVVEFSLMSNLDLFKHEIIDGDEYDDFIDCPGDQGMPSIVNAEGEYLYKIEDSWMIAFVFFVRSFLQTYGNSIKGIYLSNFYTDMGEYWILENGNDLVVWPDRTDDAGDLVPDWNLSRLQFIESFITDDMDLYTNNGILVVGGSVRELSDTKRMAINTSVSGPVNHKELFERIEDDGLTYPDYYAQSGDFIQISGLDSTGLYGLWADNEYGEGQVNLERASRVCIGRLCSLGLAYGETPDLGEGLYSIVLDPRSPRWYNY